MSQRKLKLINIEYFIYFKLPYHPSYYLVRVGDLCWEQLGEKDIFIIPEPENEMEIYSINCDQCCLFL